MYAVHDVEHDCKNQTNRSGGFFDTLKALALKNPEYYRTVSPNRPPEPERIAKPQIYDAPRF